MGILTDFGEESLDLASLPGPHIKPGQVSWVPAFACLSSLGHTVRVSIYIESQTRLQAPKIPSGP
jgi:hypothetical protein